MSGILPLFNSAPRIKIRLDGITLAYAVGFNIGLSVDIQPISVLGSYNPIALEPLMYNVVTGTMQIIRLISKDSIDKTLAYRNSLAGRHNRTIDSGIVGSGTTQTLSDTNGVTAVPGIETSNNPLAKGALYQHLDPAQVLYSRSFDIDLYLNIQDSTTASQTGEADLGKEALWMTIRDCRITSRNTNIAMGSLTNEPLTFQGIYASPTNSNGDLLFSSDSLVSEK